MMKCFPHTIAYRSNIPSWAHRHFHTQSISQGASHKPHKVAHESVTSARRCREHLNFPHILLTHSLKHIMSLLQNQFIVDEVSNVIKQAIEQTIGGNAYQHDKVNNWTGAVVENCLSVLTKQQKPYKYIGESSAVFSSSTKIHTFGVLFVSLSWREADNHHHHILP